jgi:hypothetical protein
MNMVEKRKDGMMMKGKIVWWDKKNRRGFVEYKNYNLFVYLLPNLKIDYDLKENEDISFDLEVLHNTYYIKSLQTIN